jgi:hypothetical protein
VVSGGGRPGVLTSTSHGSWRKLCFAVPHHPITIGVGESGAIKPGTGSCDILDTIPQATSDEDSGPISRASRRMCVAR